MGSVAMRDLIMGGTVYWMDDGADTGADRSFVNGAMSCPVKPPRKWRRRRSSRLPEFGISPNGGTAGRQGVGGLEPDLLRSNVM